MSLRLLLTPLLLLAVTGCGRENEETGELRLLAPADLVGDVSGFERETGCRVDLRVYDAGEDLSAIARRRDVDVVAAPAAGGDPPHDSVELSRITVERGLTITIPTSLARAFDHPAQPAGRRETRWTIRAEGENEDCARRWLAYATSG